MRQIHLLTTLVVGFPLTILIASGFPVTYWGATDLLTSRSFFGPPVTVPDRADLDSLVAAARSVPRVTRVDSISFTDPLSVAIVAVELPGSLEPEVAVEPWSARIRGVRDRHASTIQWLYSLHTRLLLDRAGADRFGKFLVCGLAVSTLLLIVTGIALWWPSTSSTFGWRNLAPILRRRHIWHDLHVKVGLYALVPLAIGSITVVMLSFSATRGSTDKVTHYPVPPSLLKRPVTFQDAARIAMTAVPDRAFAVMAHLDEPDKPLTVGLGDDTKGYRWVDVDRESGRVLNIRDVADPSQLDLISILSLHQGHRFGRVGQAIFAASSLVPLLLYTTGLYLWWRRSSRRAPRARI